jgi:hypothetical protein
MQTTKLKGPFMRKKMLIVEKKKVMGSRWSSGLMRYDGAIYILDREKGGLNPPRSVTERNGRVGARVSSHPSSTFADHR